MRLLLCSRVGKNRDTMRECPAGAGPGRGASHESFFFSYKVVAPRKGNCIYRPVRCWRKVLCFKVCLYGSYFSLGRKPAGDFIEFMTSYLWLLNTQLTQVRHWNDLIKCWYYQSIFLLEFEYLSVTAVFRKCSYIVIMRHIPALASNVWPVWLCCRSLARVNVFCARRSCLTENYPPESGHPILGLSIFLLLS
jgi:hypothetical protein